MIINWFPGHMAKTKRLILENIKLVDIVVELVDARLPLASKNPLIDELTGNKPRLIVFNKSDMADEAVTSKWVQYYAKRNIRVIETNSISGKGINSIEGAAKEVLREKIDRYREKGVNLTIKMMVVGIPNVGKSAFINKIARRASAKTGDRPGVTKGKQWIRLKHGMELLDTPGILWPKFEDQEIAKKLAFVGSIRDEILDTEELCCELLVFLRKHYPKNLEERYGITIEQELTPFELLCLIGKRRGFLVSGGEIDTLRTANMILDELRSVKIGRISLEAPGEEEA